MAFHCFHITRTLEIDLIVEADTVEDAITDAGDLWPEIDDWEEWFTDVDYQGTTPTPSQTYWSGGEDGEWVNVDK